MAESYEIDEYSFEEYSEESINVSCVCSWSINDVPQHRPVVNIRMPDVNFCSDSARISDEELYTLADRLQQAEMGDPTAHISRQRRAVRASLRDYDQEELWAGRHGPARRFGEIIESQPVPHQPYRFLVRRMPEV
jgi:hypothetical protein